MGAAVGVVLAVITVNVYLFTWRPRRGEGVERDHQPFCCPKEAQGVLRYVNASLAPCQDFFAHVCSNVIKLRSWEGATRESELDRIIVTGAVPPDLRRSPAGDFLIAYFRSCVKSVASYSYFLRNFADAVVRKERETLNAMDRKKAFLYATAMTSKYDIITAFYVQYDLTHKSVNIGYSAICRLTQFAQDVIAISADALHKGLNGSATVESVVELATALCSHNNFAGPRVVNYTADNRSEFSRDVWTIDDLDAGLAAMGYSLSDAPQLIVYGADRIGKMHRVLSAQAQSTIEKGVVAAYFLCHSVLSVSNEFYKSYKPTPQFVFKSCTRSLDKLWHIWFSFNVDTLTSPQKNSRASAIFNAVRDAVRAECHASGIFQAAEDLRLLQSFFRNLTLITPAEVRRSTSKIPKPSRDFSDNLLQGREYDFEATKDRAAFLGEEEPVQYESVNFIGGSRVYLRTTEYGSIQTGSAELPNMATLGRTIAEALWYMIFYGLPWTSETAANLSRFKHCYATFYGYDYKDTNFIDISFVCALGLSSVLKAFPRQDWFTVKPAWSLLRISHAQLFYVLTTYARCPKKSSPPYVQYINGPLMYLDDFSKAYFCPPDTLMAKSHQCALWAHQN
ncbi:hypothetical protein HPB50_006660 [Hyalomma asiaticum]|uniref:Uncharacterized protein n=1 Tax=Hyalomma asiaticum TaxID=266040 RepID=A0ACB7SVL6_HYAAI|nr:hypothetical protein HPB50_006660 [Hyalomma asiaticum]